MKLFMPLFLACITLLGFTACGGDDDDTVNATCSDGIQNQNETGVDCGGECDACAPVATDTYYMQGKVNGEYFVQQNDGFFEYGGGSESYDNYGNCFMSYPTGVIDYNCDVCLRFELLNFLVGDGNDCDEANKFHNSFPVGSYNPKINGPNTFERVVEMDFSELGVSTYDSGVEINSFQFNITESSSLPNFTAPFGIPYRLHLIKGTFSADMTLGNGENFIVEEGAFNIPIMGEIL